MALDGYSTQRILPFEAQVYGYVLDGYFRTEFGKLVEIELPDGTVIPADFCGTKAAGNYSKPELEAIGNLLISEISKSYVDEILSTREYHRDTAPIRL